MKSVGSLLWLILVVALVFIMQRLPPLEQVVDPDAIPDETTHLFGLELRTASDNAKSVPRDTAPRSQVCPTCQGEKQIQCTGCNGSGQTERVTQAQCQQCNGTGVYRSSISSRTGSPCVFCRGAGKVETRTMSSCPRCGGHRRITCPTCQGTGQSVSQSR